MKKTWFKSKTIVSGLAWAIAGVLAQYGVYTEAMSIVQMLAVAGVIYGFRDAQEDKK